VVGAAIALPVLADLGLEYVLGFGFGWTIFQALFMRDMAGGSYARSLRMTFTSELLSMNCLMGGMIVVSTLAWVGTPEAHDPAYPLFWFRMSLALMFGFIVAYPMNWWLVANHLKHGMMTVRPSAEGGAAAKGAPMNMAAGMRPAPHPSVATMGIVSFAVLAVGLLISWAFGGLSG
jgi:Domain of unknown function (DUF4396)